MYRLKIGGIHLPTVYVCRNQSEAYTARNHGIPYIIWGGDENLLAALVLLPKLRKKFPLVNWEKVLGITKKKEFTIHVPGGHVDVNGRRGVYEESDFSVSDYACEERLFDGKVETEYSDLKLSAYLGDVEINIEELQALKMLPVFLDDIATAIKKNLQALDWTEGYNKKLGVPIGNFDAGSEVNNLIILDVSGSIPRSISDTMLTLIATMKHQANAELIVTGSDSRYWGLEEEIPSAEWIRRNIGRSNESAGFRWILENKIKGRKFGHVISFGDNDTPFLPDLDLSGTEINEVHHYHTGLNYGYGNYELHTGYAKWADDLCRGTIHYNQKWVKEVE